jgi:hypothetical protein
MQVPEEILPKILLLCSERRIFYALKSVFEGHGLQTTDNPNEKNISAAAIDNFFLNAGAARTLKEMIPGIGVLLITPVRRRLRNFIDEILWIAPGDDCCASIQRYCENSQLLQTILDQPVEFGRGLWIKVIRDVAEFDEPRLLTA